MHFLCQEKAIVLTVTCSLLGSTKEYEGISPSDPAHVLSSTGAHNAVVELQYSEDDVTNSPPLGRSQDFLQQ